MNGIKDMLGHYIALSYDGQKLSDNQITEVSRAFIGGLASSLIFFRDAIKLPDDQFIKIVEKHRNEITKFFEKEINA